MRYLLIIFFTFCATISVAQNILPADTAVSIEPNSINISEYKAQKEFDYDKVFIKKESLWDKFWRIFWRFIDDILETKTGKTTLNISLLLLSIGVVAVFIWKIMEMNKSSLFQRNASEQIQFNVVQENIHEINFDVAIQQAKQQENYRLAIRLLYLQTLKLLSDKNLIKWEVNKTNTTYISEMMKHTQYSLFAQLTHHFEYVWYGEAVTPNQEFQKIEILFHQFKEKL